jgi:hypothetical protein
MCMDGSSVMDRSLLDTLTRLRRPSSLIAILTGIIRKGDPMDSIECYWRQCIPPLQNAV